jgi:hypothetical protein
MTRSRTRKKTPKRVLALPDLEHAKTAVLNSLASVSGQRTYDHAIREFVAWYCSEPRLAFNPAGDRIGVRDHLVQAGQPIACETLVSLEIGRRFRKSISVCGACVDNGPPSQVN